MQELKAFTTIGPLKKALDNGGRFYNFFDTANDEVVSRGELAKAAGVFSANSKAFLFLEMSQQDLNDKQKESILALLDAKLRRDFVKKKPLHVQPSLVDANHKPGETIILSGFARELGKETLFTGFIVVPIMIGKAMIPMMIPIHDIYNVIEVFDDEKMKQPCAVACIPQKNQMDLSGRVQFGGVLKGLRNKTKEPPTHPAFLEAIFWMKR